MSVMLGGWGQGNNRLPPNWSPENAAYYQFRQWSRDVLLWSIMHQDANESRKVAAIVSVFRGAAQELFSEIPPQIILQGGPVNGIQTDPVTYVMHMLAENYAQLGEEVRLSSLTEFLNFQRRSGEMTDELITRIPRRTYGPSVLKSCYTAPLQH